MANTRQHTAAHEWHEPHNGQPLMGRQRGAPGTASLTRDPDDGFQTSG